LTDVVIYRRKREVDGQIWKYLLCNPSTRTSANILLFAMICFKLSFMCKKSLKITKG